MELVLGQQGIYYIFLNYRNVKLYRLRRVFLIFFVLRYRCKCYRTRNCRASLIRVDGQFITNGVHNHPNHSMLIRRYLFTDWCRQEAANTNVAPYSIYLSALRQFPGRPPVRWRSIASSVYRARHANVPPIPTSPEHYAELISNYPRYR